MTRCRLLIRLFDQNGNYLTHFTTESLDKLFGGGYESMDRVTDFFKQENKYSLTYEVNMRDLRDAEIGELGLDFSNY